jgi:hypothetical protein
LRIKVNAEMAVHGFMVTNKDERGVISNVLGDISAIEEPINEGIDLFVVGSIDVGILALVDVFIDAFVDFVLITISEMGIDCEHHEVERNASGGGLG